jgi:hypothetical protein
MWESAGIPSLTRGQNMLWRLVRNYRVIELRIFIIQVVFDYVAPKHLSL